MNIDRALEVLAADPSADVDVADVALGLARDEYPAISPSQYLAEFDHLADRLRPRLRGPLCVRVAALTDLLFHQEGFRGDADRYYDPDNSYLNRVIDRRLGLPITLTVVAAAVAARAGLQVEGVGLPGHFIARAVDGPQVVLFDPFNGGRALTVADCERMVEKATGGPYQAAADAFGPTPPGPTVRRMLTNLKSVYLRQGDFQRAARVTRRIMQLEPDNVAERRDLGVCLMQSGQPGAAIDLLQAYLGHSPTNADAELVRKLVVKARAEVARWN
jgi:regulator of sirC expression with transglutaminase-like and TPR domain